MYLKKLYFDEDLSYLHRRKSTTTYNKTYFINRVLSLTLANFTSSPSAILSTGYSYQIVFQEYS